jgi:uncharacterized protein
VYALGLGLAALIGLSLGVLGGGGSILTVPVFVYVFGFEAKQAIAMSLAVVGAVSAVGAVGHWRVGNVNLRVAVVFGSVAMAGTYLGARLAVYFSGAAQLALFAVVMLIAAVLMLRDGRSPPRAAPPSGAGRPGGAGGAAPVPPHGRMPLILIVGEGLAVGVLTGLVGVGGGFLIVPALVVLGRLQMREAVGTSLVVIAMKSASGFAGYVPQVEIPWGWMGAFTAVAMVGILGGTRLVPLIPQPALKRGFAVFLLVMGSFILYQNRAAVGTEAGATAAGGMVEGVEIRAAGRPWPSAGTPGLADASRRWGALPAGAGARHLYPRAGDVAARSSGAAGWGGVRATGRVGAGNGGCGLRVFR